MSVAVRGASSSDLADLARHHIILASHEDHGPPLEPDVLVEVTDRLVVAEPRRRLGGAAAFDEGVVAVDDGGGRRIGVVALPSDGSPRAELRCERGSAFGPVLRDVILLTALDAGCLPLHAAIVHHDGAGIAFIGWSGAGKTSALLACARAGASPVAAEWSLVGEDGRAHTLPQPVRLKPAHLDQWPALAGAVPPREVARMRRRAAARRVATATATAAAKVAPRVASLATVLTPAAFVDLDPQALGSPTSVTTVDHVVVLEAATVRRPVLVPVDRREVLDRLAHALAYDLQDAVRLRHLTGFAHPKLPSSGLERLHGAVHSHLGRAAVHLLRHDPPTPPDELHRLVASVTA